jgi:hypothetical protein
MPISAKKVLEYIGDPKEIAKSLRKFKRAAIALSADEPRLVQKYPNKWIVVFRGEVKAATSTFDAAMKKVKALNLPKDEVFIRHMLKKRKTMIFGSLC